MLELLREDEHGISDGFLSHCFAEVRLELSMKSHGENQIVIRNGTPAGNPEKRAMTEWRRVRGKCISLIPQGPPSSGIALPMPEVKEICGVMCRMSYS
jgi:hypothetical protein